MIAARILLPMLLLASALVAGPAPAKGGPVCLGKGATIVGTGKADVLRGTRGPDVIVGRGGDDVIRGLGGNDRLCGDAGDDRLLGGPGKDACLQGRGDGRKRSCEKMTPHRIGVRAPGGVGELYDRKTKATYVPRGANLLSKRVTDTGTTIPGLFSNSFFRKKQMAATLTEMAALGYNAVRVFVDLCPPTDCISGPKGDLRDAFLDNITTFLSLARKRGIQVLLTSNDIPDRGYAEKLPCCEPYGGYRNSLYLSPGGVKIGARYFRDLVRGLVERDAPLDAILAYQLANEQFVLTDVAPLSLTGGIVQGANGKPYDMADPAAKERIVEDSLLHYIAKVRAKIRKIDRTALVTMGFFAPEGPNPWRSGDPRLVRTARIVTESALDLVDLHAYPDEVLTLPQYVQNFGVAGPKPIVMGEFGAFTPDAPSPAAASGGLVDWQAASCAHGFDGWFHWLWADRDDEVWGGLEQGGAINHVLAPTTRPDPCVSAGLGTANIARGKAATASQSLPDQPPAMALDGRAETNWGSGDGPPQWLEVDLGTGRQIREIALRVSQFPEGPTTHQVFVREPGGPDQLVATLSGFTREGDWLRIAHTAANIRYVRIETTAGPSWVSWGEVQVFEEPV